MRYQSANLQPWAVTTSEGCEQLTSRQATIRRSPAAPWRYLYGVGIVFLLTSIDKITPFRGYRSEKRDRRAPCWAIPVALASFSRNVYELLLFTPAPRGKQHHAGTAPFIFSLCFVPAGACFFQAARTAPQNIGDVTRTPRHRTGIHAEEPDGPC